LIQIQASVSAKLKELEIRRVKFEKMVEARDFGTGTNSLKLFYKG
jgi:hypothetical protein